MRFLSTILLVTFCILFVYLGLTAILASKVILTELSMSEVHESQGNTGFIHYHTEYDISPGIFQGIGGGLIAIGVGFAALSYRILRNKSLWLVPHMRIAFLVICLVLIVGGITLTVISDDISKESEICQTKKDYLGQGGYLGYDKGFMHLYHEHTYCNNIVPSKTVTGIGIGTCIWGIICLLWAIKQQKVARLTTTETN